MLGSVRFEPSSAGVRLAIFAQTAMAEGLEAIALWRLAEVLPCLALIPPYLDVGIVFDAFVRARMVWHTSVQPGD